MVDVGRRCVAVHTRGDTLRYRSAIVGGVTRVVIVDDDVLVRSGLRQSLGAASDIDVVAVSSGRQAMAVIDRCRPDVVLLDLRMSDVDCLTVLGPIGVMAPSPVVAILTTCGSNEYVTAALRCGVAGLIPKDADPQDLTRFVRMLAGRRIGAATGFPTPCLEDPGSRPAG